MLDLAFYVLGIEDNGIVGGYYVDFISSEMLNVQTDLKTIFADVRLLLVGVASVDPWWQTSERLL